MSKMLRLELVGFLLLTCTQILTEHRVFYEPRNQYGYHQRYHEPTQRSTREIRVQQGRLRGVVVQPRSQNLQLVDVFLGVPYAEPPVGSIRFSPPRSPEPWRGVRQSQEFAPVCPQLLPNLRDEAKPGRYEYLERHLPYLRNQSEDCLYLNIYAPHQAEGQKNLRTYPVMMFIHGESFEWNSGNPYDGTILAAYGNVVFVTINFRLGILGFLRPGIRDDTVSNFGLLDQIAALVWLRENIHEFGGDPNRVTLVGHGTGAIFANLLLISPVANKKGLFKRAILMSGSALSPDAIGKAPLQITKQVAHALNCPTTSDSELALCLRGQDVNTLLNVKIHKPKYVPAFAPLIDNAVIPDKPLNLMKNTQLFGRYDLMYGVTESEKFHILPSVALHHGMSDGQRDEILRDHAKATHELEPELVVSKILEQYGDFSARFTNEYATKNRDMVLDALSDSGTLAPLATIANLHSKANPKSYMYVFTHTKTMQDYPALQQQRTVHGEELPYVLGVPLDGSKYDLRRRYSIEEALFSEAMMNWWCSFAYIGIPNVANQYPYLTDSFKEWGQYEIEWPEYDRQNQTYLNLTIPPETGSRYRAAEIQFWNEDLPKVLRHPNKDVLLPMRPKGPRPQILDIADGIGSYANGTSSKDYEIFGIKYTTNRPPDVTNTANEEQKPPYTVLASSPQPDVETTTETTMLRNSSVITMMIGFGVVFLLINITAFLYLFHRRQSSKAKEKNVKRRASQKDDTMKRHKMDKHDNHYGELGYKSDSKPDLNEVIKNDKAYDNNSNFGRRSKLSRQNSGSTIDTHIKVREWIQQEIVHRCSPRFLRKTRETLQKEHQEKITKQQQEEKKRLEEEMLKERQEESMYDENPALVVRPGKKSKLPKVSVAIDATPAMRTESILNQVPIELSKTIEPLNESFDKNFDFPIPDPSQFQMAPQVVVIEHHHSKSDPLPMESTLKSVKPNFSTSRIYESDSGSANSLYAKINPKQKSRLPRPGHVCNLDGPAMLDGEQHPIEDTYVKTGPKLTTFGVNTAQPCDINVTCREPILERECISPEEALRTIKRRNYPKVLPDIEKRRSLPAPNSLFLPKYHGNLLRDYRIGAQPISPTGQPPLPPPRMFGPSKSLEFAEESENQCENEPVTTNLHVGPLLRKPDFPVKNNSDPSIIDTFDERVDLTTRMQPGGSVDTIYSNPMCPVHGISSGFSPGSQSVEKDIGNPGSVLDGKLGNPNWYKPARRDNGMFPPIAAVSSEPRIVITPRDPEKQPQFGTGSSNWDVRLPSAEPKIVITPRVGNLLEQANQSVSPTVWNLGNSSASEKNGREVKTTDLPATEAIAMSILDSVNKSSLGSSEQLGLENTTGTSSLESKPAGGVVREPERKEPRIIIAPREPKNCGAGTNLKQPKIIIKPTSTLQRNRDQRNIPKVSAIPSPESQNCQNIERELRAGAEKPPLREKPKVTRIPSFSRRKEEPSSGIEKTTTSTGTPYVEKTEIVQRVEASPGKVSNVSLMPDNKSSIPTFQKKENEKSSSTDSSASNGNSNGSNTGTIKRKPSGKK